MQKDTIVKISSYYSAKNYSMGYAKDSKTTFSLLETAKNPSCTAENLSKNEKLRKTTFFEFSLNVSENPKETFKNRGGFR